MKLGKYEFSLTDTTKVQEKPLDNANQETSFADSSYYQKYQLRPYNPAELYQKRGSYQIYDDMREDDQISSVLALKKIIVLNTEWCIECDNQEVADFLYDNFNKYLDDAFIKKMYEMLSAYDYGVSITEKVFDVVDTQEHGKKICLTKLKTRAPHTFELHTDAQGNLEKILQHTGMRGDIILDPQKFIVYSRNKEFDNPYGNSELNKGVYRAWWSKDAIYKFRNIYLEKYGMPTAIGKMPRTASSQDKTSFFNALSNIQSRTAMTMPEDFEVSLLETSRGGSEYQDAINQCNLSISRKMLVPDLLGVSGAQSGGGSYALGKEQFSMFYSTVNYDRIDIVRIINREIINPLVSWNFGNKEYAEFKFKPIDNERREKMLRMWLDAVNGGKIPLTNQHINWFLGGVEAPEIPEEDLPGSEDDENASAEAVAAESRANLRSTASGVSQILQVQQSVSDGVTDYDGAVAIVVEVYGFDIEIAKMILGDKDELMRRREEKKAMAEKISGVADEKKEDEKAEEETDTEQPEKDGESDSGPDTSSDKGSEDTPDDKQDPKEFAAVEGGFSRSFTKYESKVNFARISNGTEDLTLSYKQKLADAFTLCINGLINDIKTKKIVEKRAFAQVGKLDLRNYAKVEKLMRDMLKDASALAIETVETPPKKEFNVNVSAGLDNEDVAAWLTENAFYISGIEKENILKSVKGILLDSIRNGSGIRDIIKQIDEALSGYSIVIGRTDIEQAARIETIARTNINKAFNEVRAMQYNEMAEYITAYQYSAILDGRTSDICLALDKKIFKPSELEYYNPPNHFRCRSLIVPIFNDEQFDGFSELPATEMQNGSFLTLKK